jgi:hypothetical protein
MQATIYRIEYQEIENIAVKIYGYISPFWGKLKRNINNDGAPADICVVLTAKNKHNQFATDKYNVTSLFELNENVKKGCIGTVVFVYQEARIPTFEIEFVNDNKQTLDVLTVEVSKIGKI